jgi:hypothetical protein
MDNFIILLFLGVAAFLLYLISVIIETNKLVKMNSRKLDTLIKQLEQTKRMEGNDYPDKKQ